MWQKPGPPFKVTRGGIPIENARLSEGVDTKIAHTMSYAEYDACVSCGLDLWKWENRQYSRQFMAKVVAFHQLKGLVRSHSEDAARAKKR